MCGQGGHRLPYQVTPPKSGKASPEAHDGREGWMTLPKREPGGYASLTKRPPVVIFERVSRCCGGTLCFGLSPEILRSAISTYLSPSYA